MKQFRYTIKSVTTETEKITPAICKKLEKISFDDGEINTIKIIHELNTWEYSIDDKKLVNQIAFEEG